MAFVVHQPKLCVPAPLLVGLVIKITPFCRTAVGHVEASANQNVGGSNPGSSRPYFKGSQDNNDETVFGW